MGQGERLRLGFAEEGVGRATRITGIFVVGEVDPVERKVALAEVRAPCSDHRRETCMIFGGAVGIALALIPEGAAEGVGREGVDHTVVKTGGRPRITRAAGRARLRIFLQPRGVELGAVGLRFRLRSGGRGVEARGRFRLRPRDKGSFEGRAFRGEVGERLLPTGGDGGEVGIGRERGRTHPRLDRRAAPGAVHDAHGHAEFLKNIAGEEIAHGSKCADGLRRGRLPAIGLDGFHGRGGAGLLDPHVADQREIRGGDFSGGVLHAAAGLPGAGPGLDGELHVGLTRTEPNFADDDVAHGERIFSGDGQVHPDGARRQCVEIDDPTAIGPGGRAAGLFAQRDRDFFAGIGATPDGHGLVALQHGMIREERRERDVGLDEPGEGGKNRE